MAAYKWTTGNIGNKTLIEAEIANQGVVGIQFSDPTPDANGDYWFDDGIFVANENICNSTNPDLAAQCFDWVGLINTALGTSYADTDAWLAAEWPSGEDVFPVEVSQSVVNDTTAILESMGIPVPVKYEVSTTNSSYTEIHRVTIASGDSKLYTVKVVGKRTDDNDLYHTLYAVSAYNFNSADTDTTKLHEEKTDNNYRFRVQESGDDVIFQVRGKGGHDLDWQLFISEE